MNRAVQIMPQPVPPFPVAKAICRGTSKPTKQPAKRPSNNSFLKKIRVIDLQNTAGCNHKYIFRTAGAVQLSIPIFLIIRKLAIYFQPHDFNIISCKPKRSNSNTFLY
jgi:hypothetical protein